MVKALFDLTAYVVNVGTVVLVDFPTAGPVRQSFAPPGL